MGVYCEDFEENQPRSSSIDTALQLFSKNANEQIIAQYIEGAMQTYSHC